MPTSATTALSPAPAHPTLPSGPPGWPVLGHLPHMRREGLLPFLERTWRQYGDVFSVNLGFPETR